MISPSWVSFDGWPVVRGEHNGVYVVWTRKPPCYDACDISTTSISCAHHLLAVQTCTLYRNSKPAPEFLFVAAAALYALTGDASYRADADSMFPTGPQSVEQQSYLYNWNNVLTQGIVILSMEPDVPGAQRSRTFYRGFLRTSVGLWSQCSNDGEATINFYTFCECAAPHEHRHTASVIFSQ